MKKILLISAMALLIGCSQAEADHSDNGKCLDEIKHWNSLTDAQKSEADARAKRDEGANHWAQGDKAECEADYKQAIILATD
jgi:hypothetical protein